MEQEPEREIVKGLTRAEWLLLSVLAAVQFVHSMDFMVMMPLGPKCREELNISPQQFALVVSSYGFSAAIAGLLAASFIDRFDSKNALLILLGGRTAGTLRCALAPGYWSLMRARTVAGAVGGGGGAFTSSVSMARSAAAGRPAWSRALFHRPIAGLLMGMC